MYNRCHALSRLTGFQIRNVFLFQRNTFGCLNTRVRVGVVVSFSLVVAETWVQFPHPDCMKFLTYTTENCSTFSFTFTLPGSDLLSPAWSYAI